MKRRTTLAAMAVLAGLFTGNALAAEPAKPGENFMKLSPEQRSHWIDGAVLTMSVFVSVHDRPKGQCISGWYLGNRVARHREVEGMLRADPESYPTSIVLSLLTKACGVLPAS